jgi:hypothetical protein
LSEIQRGNEDYIYRSEMTVATSHHLLRDPTFDSDQDFKDVQMLAGLTLVEEMIWTCVTFLYNKRQIARGRSPVRDGDGKVFTPPARAWGDGRHPNKESAITRALAYYYLKASHTDTVIDIRDVATNAYFQANLQNLADNCKRFVKVQLWTQCPTKGEFVAFVHDNICKPLLNLEGLPNYPLWRHPAAPHVVGAQGAQGAQGAPGAPGNPFGIWGDVWGGNGGG